MWMIPWVVVVAAIGSALATSDTCSVFQIHTTIQAIDGVLSSGDCADYASNGSTLEVPCAAASCVGLVEDLVSKLPNCTLAASDNGGASVNKKVELQDALGECSADSSSSISVEAVATSTNGAATSATSASAGECTSAEASTISQLYLKAAESSACAQYSSTDESGSMVYVNAPCSATQCVSVMETLVGQLPDCYWDGANLKEDVLESLGSCTGVDSSTSVSSRSANECSDTEVSSLTHLINSIVTSAACSSYVISTSTEWYISVPCTATSCLSTLADVVRQMPDCDFEGVNYKGELGLQQSSCPSGGGSSGGGSSRDSLTTQEPGTSVNSTGTSGFHSSKHYVACLSLLFFAVVVVATEY